MVDTLRFWVAGVPAPQGSKDVFVFTTKSGKKVHNVVEVSKKVKPWRAAVRLAAQEAQVDRFEGPVSVGVTFYLKRPQDHFHQSKGEKVLRPDAPTWHHIRPDIDKLLRSTFDGITESGVWQDDSQVAEVIASKQYLHPADSEMGAWVRIQQRKEMGWTDR